MITFVCVVNKMDVFTSTILDNVFMNSHAIHMIDNREQNIGIAERYNDFIDNSLPDNSWIVFCHQDFGLQENISIKLDGLDRGSIYGPTGAAGVRQLVCIGAMSRYGIERLRIGFYKRWKKFGQVTQITPQKTRKMGRKIRKPVIVDTVDSCCLIIHSSLINRYKLRFDEALQWHLYAEDLSLNARYNHGIFTKAVQLKCVHLSGGTIDYLFHENLNYLKKKYGTERFATTCYDGYSRF